MHARCRALAETVDLTCGSIPCMQKTVYNTLVGHAGDMTSISPFLSFARVDQQRLYRSNLWSKEVALDGIRHRTNTRPSIASPNSDLS